MRSFQPLPAFAATNLHLHQMEVVGERANPTTHSFVTTAAFTAPTLSYNNSWKVRRREGRAWMRTETASLLQGVEQSPPTRHQYEKLCRAYVDLEHGYHRLLQLRPRSGEMANGINWS